MDTHVTGLFAPAVRVRSVRPVTQKIVVVGGVIFLRIEEFFELGVRYRRAIQVERFHVHALAVRAARSVFPGVLNIYAGVVAAFDFFAADYEIVIAFGDADHSRRRS